MSVRKGCTLTVYDEGSLTGTSATIVAPQHKDLHVNLGDSNIKNAKSLADDIESLKCSCN